MRMAGIPDVAASLGGGYLAVSGYLSVGKLPQGCGLRAGCLGRVGSCCVAEVPVLGEAGLGAMGGQSF